MLNPNSRLPPLLSRDDLIQWFVRLQLSDYEVMFHDSMEVAWLDKVRERRGRGELGEGGSG